MLRRVALIVAAIALAACGAGPTAPASAPIPRYVLAAGSFTLTIAAAPVNLNPGSLLVCASIGSGAPTSIAIPVEVHPEGPGWVIRPSSGTLKMMLAEIGTFYFGELQGSATSGATTVSIASGTSAAVSAPTLGVSNLQGLIDGDVRYASGGLQASCNGNGWSLTPR